MATSPKERISVSDNAININFKDANNALAADMTDTQLIRAGGTEGYVAPCAGCVVALTAHIPTAATAGTLTIGVTVDGTENTSTTQTVTTGTKVYQQFSRTLVRFVAGQVIGCEVTTDSSWNSTGAIDADVLVLLENMTF